MNVRIYTPYRRHNQLTQQKLNQPDKNSNKFNSSRIILQQRNEESQLNKDENIQNQLNTNNLKIHKFNECLTENQSKKQDIDLITIQPQINQNQIFFAYQKLIKAKY
ncbi:hypothetical protein ABPG72_001911 [Tetrahymena utriculariae]